MQRFAMKLAWRLMSWTFVGNPMRISIQIPRYPSSKIERFNGIGKVHLVQLSSEAAPQTQDNKTQDARRRNLT